MTKTYRIVFWILAAISILLNVGPLAAYSISALVTADLVVEKVALCSTVFIVLILTAVAAINKVAMKSRLWILLIGIYICLDSVMTPIIIIGICQILDELIVSPLKSNFGTKLTISKELDKRLKA
jgi:hypothetical protein